MAKIVVGMSGGVDSAVAAYLLKAAGHDVIGVTLKTWLNSEGEVSRCCEIDDARRVAHRLDIPYYAVNCAAEFRSRVVEPFTAAYIAGTTPNPCVGCNRCVKWEGMLSFANSVGAQYAATGHYAKIVQLPSGRFSVKNAASAQKDQTYMLYQLTQEQLSRTIMPLGELDKGEVRRIAEAVNLPVAGKPDSQEICFIAEGNYADYIEQNSESYEPKTGNFVDENGAFLGIHRGIIHYTVGQRKGLGVALGRPMYVKKINAAENEVILCEDSALYAAHIVCTDLNFQSIPKIEMGEEITAVVRIRYHHGGERAVLRRLDDSTLSVDFERPVRAPAPGQSAVFYDDDGCVIGGGIICQ